MTTSVPARRVSWSLTALLTFIWAVLGAAIATASWAAITSVPELTGGASLGWLRSAFVYGLYFGGVIALVSLVPYWGLLLLYAFLFARRPAVEQSATRFLAVALVLACPIALAVFISYLDPWSPFGPSWGDALLAGPCTLISAWIGIVAPRLLIPSWRPGTWWVAA